MKFMLRCLIKILRLSKIERIISDEVFLKIQYRYSIGKKLNVEHPKTFNEKIQWLKLNDRNPIYSVMVDKYLVREFVADRMGKEYLTKCYGVYYNFDEIDKKRLPNSFVLKTTHDSGTVIICNDLLKFNFEDCKVRIDKAMSKNFYYSSREWPYKRLIPKIIIEENLSINGKIPDDYKIMCFNGKAKVIQYHTDRFMKHKQYHYDSNGNLLDLNNVGYSSCEAPQLDMNVVNKMIELAEGVATKFINIRIDFFYVNGKIYFGEFTFYDSAGMCPWNGNGDEWLGGLIHIGCEENENFNRW